MNKLYITCIICTFFINTAFAVNGQFYLHGPSWQEKVNIEGSSFCRQCGDCASVEKYAEDGLKVIWKDYPVEFFIKDGNEWFVSDDAYVEYEYNQLEYTFENPYVKLDPYKKSPLTALVKFPTKNKAKISLIIKGQGKDPDIAHDFQQFNTEHEYPILGLYPNYLNTIILKATYQNGLTKESTFQIQTNNLPLKGQILVLHKEDTDFNYYASSNGIIWDEYGNIRYFISDPSVISGLIYFIGDGFYSEHRNSGITQFSILGKKLKQFTYPKGFQSFAHGLHVKPNGNILILGSMDGTKAFIDNEMRETHRDIVLELDAITGNVIKKYDLAELLNPDRNLIIKSSTIDFGKVDWAHINGIDYDKKNQSVIVSGRHIGMLKIDEKTGKLTWWMTPHQQLDKSGRYGQKEELDQKVLTIVNRQGKKYPIAVQKGIENVAGFKWPTKTHNVRYLGNNHYAILDNAGDVYDKSLYTTQNSVASIYKIDDTKKIAYQVFIKILPFYSPVGSSVTTDKSGKIWACLSTVSDKNNKSISSSYIFRYNQNGKELYRAIETSPNWNYRLYPYYFYQKNYQCM